MPTANFPPLYPAVISFIHFIGLGSAFSLQIIGAIVGGVTVVLTGVLARRIGGDLIGLVSAVVAACWPALIAADGSVMSENLAIPLALWAVLAVWSAQERGGVGRWALAGVPLGLAALTRSELPLLAACLLLIAVMAGGKGRKRRLAHAGVSVLVMVVILLPWTINRVHAVGSEAALSTNGAKTLAGANCPLTYSGADLGGWQISCVNAAIEGATGEAAQARQARDQGLSYLKKHADRVPLVIAARELRLFGAWSPSTLAAAEVMESRDAGWQRLAWWTTVLTLPLTAVGVIALWRRRPIAVAPVIAVALVAAVTWGNQRLRLVAEPSLIIALALSATASIHAVRHRRSLRAGTAAELRSAACVDFSPSTDPLA